ncbi:hypothetical protein [Frigoribacterium endophyticum]|uniref:hypothetical protein n=1 Tax=Frigoribacterium endophyticum TaxID=1522176 RepID=UPI00141E519E|nr:hypothetical protein [Frigoribacterium endophyticum]NII52161.1 hypothetical protein [Frigoribacterium endophyticum]
MTNNRHHDEHDDNQVIAWMRDADPVSDLTPLPAWQLERLKETAMTTTTTTPAPARNRRRLFAVAGISAAAAAAIIGGVVLTGPGSTGGGVTALSAPAAGGPAAMCAEVTPEALASSTLAFRGTVTSTADGLVTFRVDDVFTGDVEQTVTVSQGDSDVPVDGAAPVFEDGGTYLVSTTENVIQSCGLTGEDSPELSSLYDQAF